MNLSNKEGALLLKLARQSIKSKFDNNENALLNLKQSASKTILEENRGAFVTLHINKQLRGCIGNIEPVKTIFASVEDNAKKAAFHDPRFKALSYEELDEIDIDISILTKPLKLEYDDANDLIVKLKPEIDGVIIRKNNHGATFLPQVWKQLNSAKLFLSHLCMKAGLSSDEWETGELDVFLYQVQMFEE